MLENFVEMLLGPRMPGSLRSGIATGHKFNLFFVLTFTIFQKNKDGMAQRHRSALLGASGTAEIKKSDSKKRPKRKAEEAAGAAETPGEPEPAVVTESASEAKKPKGGRPKSNSAAADQAKEELLKKLAG